MWSFTTAQKGKALSYSEIDFANAAIFSEQHNLQYYTPEIQSVVYETFNIDFKHFGYPFEIPNN